MPRGKSKKAVVVKLPSVRPEKRSRHTIFTSSRSGVVKTASTTIAPISDAAGSSAGTIDPSSQPADAPESFDFEDFVDERLMDDPDEDPGKRPKYVSVSVLVVGTTRFDLPKF